MPTDCISYQTSGYFSKLMQDYLDQKSELKTLYNHFPTLENFEKQIAEKEDNFDNANRIPLVETLKRQYQNIEISDTCMSFADLSGCDMSHSLLNKVNFKEAKLKNINFDFQNNENKICIQLSI